MITVKEYKERYIKQLCKSSASYFEIGAELFHEAENGEREHTESILGNVCIAVELAMKAYLANKSLTLVYEKLPDKLHITLLCQDEFLLTDSWSDILNDKMRSISFDRCIVLISTILSDKSKECSVFSKYISELKSVRNNSVHSVMSVDNPVVFIATIFSSMKVLEILLAGIPEDTGLHDMWKDYSESDFYNNQNEKLLAKVKGKINTARNSKKFNTQIPLVQNEFEEVLYDCPACSSKALLSGTIYRTDAVSEFDPVVLYTEKLKCNSCTLLLDDYEELELAKIPEFVELNKTYSDAEEYWSELYFVREIRNLFGTKDEALIKKIKLWCEKKAAETRDSEQSCLMKMYDDALDKRYEKRAVQQLKLLRDNEEDYENHLQTDLFFEQNLSDILGENNE
ncbi:MAG: hypothetical protein BM556_13485 [Bacteriovorax sp. MedPE-SWde]|nr:MAG: hypothetical protein BM556_13485 [Bacteriovorax sp. MedPE-SWde]